MAFKFNISHKGKAYKAESDDEGFLGKKIGDKFDGSEVSSDLAGYELEIKGTSDIAGFPGLTTEDGPNLRKVLFTKGKFLHKVKAKGVRMKKSVRGNEISEKTVQINCVVVKEGIKKFAELFEVKEEAAPEATA